VLNGDAGNDTLVCDSGRYTLTAFELEH